MGDFFLRKLTMSITNKNQQWYIFDNIFRLFWSFPGLKFNLLYHNGLVKSKATNICIISDEYFKSWTKFFLSSTNYLLTSFPVRWDPLVGFLQLKPIPYYSSTLKI